MTDRVRQRPPHPVVVALEPFEPEETYAWLLGKVVLAISDVDYVLADVVAAVLGDGHDAARAAWGRSGDQLRDELRKAEEQDPGVRSLREEYERLYKERNALVHGMFVGSSGEDLELHDVVRLVRSTKKAPTKDYETESRTWDQIDLGRLLIAAEDLQTAALVMIQQHRLRA